MGLRLRHCHWLVGALMLALCGLPLAQAADSQRNAALIRQAVDQSIRLLNREDAQRAIDYISGRHPADIALEVFILVTRELYWQHRDLTAALVMGRAGLQHGLREAHRTESRNFAVSQALKARSKVLAYDLSSFCWPGWQEEGIEIPGVYLIHGQDLAQVNMRLARELEQGDLPMSRAWWLLGAHFLAAGDHERARRAFLEGIKRATAAGTDETEKLLRGYVYLTDILKSPGNDELAAEFDFIRSELARSQTGQFFSDQLETARLAFTDSNSMATSAWDARDSEASQ